MTVEAIDRNPTGNPPRNALWSPDGRLLTWIVDAGHGPVQDGKTVGEAGDIVQVEAATGRIRVLATADQLNALGSSSAISEKDRDHRDRYNMSAFLWADDAKHLLLDKGGPLWLYDVAAGTGTLIVDTHAGSGDDPKFSPDGRFVSYLRDHNLYVYPVQSGGKGKEIALTNTKVDTLLNGEIDWVYLEELDARSNYAWSPDSANIAYIQTDEAKVPVYRIEDFLPIHEGVDRQRFPQAGDPNPVARVGIVAAKGGKTNWISLPLSLGNDYIPRIGWVDSQTVYVQVLTRDQQRLGLYFADIHTGVSRLVHSETDSKYLEANYDVTMLPHGRFLSTSWRDGHTHLYLYQFDERHPLDQEATLVRRLTEGDYEVETVAAPRIAGEVPTVFFTSTEGSPLEDNLWSIGLDGTGKRKLTGAHGTHEISVSPDGVHFSDLASSLGVPPVFSLCSMAAESVCSQIWASSPSGPTTGTSTSIVTTLAADGVTTLYGTLTQPAPADNSVSAPASIPLILNPYGGPLPTAGVRNTWGGIGYQIGVLLAQRGYAVLTIDNRGSGGRGRAFQQADYLNFGPVQFADQLAALNQTLARNPQFDPQRIGWWGWSWGGTFTLYAMTHSDRIRAGAAVAPVTDFRNYDSVYTERYLGLPATNPDVYKTASVTASAANLKGRVLIAQGTGDDNVHLSNTIQFLQPLINAGIPYDLQLFPRLTHSIASVNARNELFNRLLYHFETYLKPIPVKP